MPVSTIDFLHDRSAIGRNLTGKFVPKADLSESTLQFAPVLRN